MATVEAERPLAAVYGTAGSGRAGAGPLVEAVNRVIDRREITTVFQPLVDLETGAVVGYEAFARARPGVQSSVPSSCWKELAWPGAWPSLTGCAPPRPATPSCAHTCTAL